MVKKVFITGGILALLLLTVQMVLAQDPFQRIRDFGGRFGGSGDKTTDSLGHRTGLEDSITISFRYLDSTRYSRFDSSYKILSDFSQRYPIPNDYVFLGNSGNAARPIYFSPIMKSGWDAGFHAYDVYQLDLFKTRFYTTTRPYSEIGYLLGSKAEQMVHALHTQNITPDWNAAFQYDLINSPGAFKNQNTNHNNYRLNTAYQGKKRRYHLYFILQGNKIQGSENGGIKNSAYIDSLQTYKERGNIPVQLGNYVQPGLNPFNSKLTTGTKYKTLNFFLRQQYDFGKRDSLVTDSNVVYMFYPRIRAEHTLQYNSYLFQYVDQEPDTVFYRKNYNFAVTPPAGYAIEEKWKEMINDVSFYSFPDIKNVQQFIKVGAALQNLTGTFDAGAFSRKFYNFYVHGEYRNKTRNRKWDMELNGKLFVTGLNAGDYDAFASLKRYISRKLGYLELGFQNVNRKPSTVFSNISSFTLAPVGSFNKENIVRIMASLDQPYFGFKLTGNYYLVNNYAYYKNYYEPAQASGLFNLLQVTAEKEIRLRKHLVWHALVMLQQRLGDGPVNVPLIFTNNRIGYEGTLGFKNLRLATGVEVKYHTAYDAYGYSPLTGQFYYQDTSRISWRTPQVNGYAHFRIRSFTAYVRAENLNTARLKDGFGFTNNNFAALDYPYPGFIFRVGIFWSFVN